MMSTLSAMSDWTIVDIEPDDLPPEDHHHQGEDPPDLDDPVYDELYDYNGDGS